MKNPPRRLFGRKRTSTPELPTILDYPSFLSAVINNLSGGLIVVGKNEKIIYYNAAALDLLNTNTDLNGKNITDILKLKTKTNRSFNVSDKLKKTQVFTVFDDVRYYLDPEEFLRLEVSVSPIRSGFSSSASLVSGHVIFFRDITHAKDLDDERDEFISVISHELRTPVAVMEGAVSNLQLMAKQGTIKKSALNATLTSVHDQVVSLSEIINSLSALSRSEHDTGLVFEPVSVNDLLNHLYTIYQPRAAKKNLTLDLNMNLTTTEVTTLRPHLEEIIQNFITNAIKYTDSGGITLSAVDSGNDIVISVSDTGIGISKADQKHIFEKFFRSEDFRTRKSEGIGLGLYISFKLAKKIGAEMALESRQGYGSTFSLILPRTVDNKT